MRDIAVEFQFDSETWRDDAEGKRLRYDLMQRDFWSGLRKLHKDYRHPERVGCDTYERAFKKQCKWNIMIKLEFTSMKSEFSPRFIFYGNRLLTVGNKNYIIYLCNA